MRVMASLITLAFAAAVLVVPAPTLAPAPGPACPTGGDREATFGFAGIEIYKLEPEVFGLAFGDLDGDGRDDFGFVNNPRSRIELFQRLPDEAADQIDPTDPDLYNEITYDGRFKKDYLPVEQEIYGLALGRFDGDGVLDAAFITATPELIVELRGKGRDTEKLEDFRPRPAGLTCADLDGDGVDDLIVLGEQKTLLKLSNGQTATLYNYAQKPGSLALGDFNGDGLKDLLYVYYEGDYPLAIRFQEAPGVFGPTATWKLESIRSFDVADMDGDGRDDILAVYAKSGRLARFALGAAESPAFRFYALRGTESPDKTTFTTADVDRDGAEEILIADADAARIVVMGGFGAGSASRRTEYPSLKGVADPRVADFDGDGVTELAVISGDEGVIGMAALDGGVAFPRFISVEGKPLALSAGDVDGDGVSDAVCVAATGAGKNKKYILNVLSQAGGTDKVATIPIGDSAKEPVLKKDPEDMLLADVNRDGLPDVILLPPKDVPVILFNSAGEVQRFTTHMGEETPGLGLLEGARPWTIGPADGDADGVSELAVASGNLVRFIYIPPQGDVPQAVRQYNNPSPGGNLAGFAVADVIGGAEPELLVYESNTRSVRVVGGGDAILMELDAGRLDFRGIETPDLNGDGKHDFVILGAERIGVWMSGETAHALVEQGTFESDDKEAHLQDVAAGDVNGDGTADVVVVDLHKNALVIVSTEEGEMKKALQFRVFEEKLFESGRGSREPHVVRIHDVTGDGRQDVILLVHDKIVICPQD